MWAIGVINYILLCGFPPFRSKNKDQEELFSLIMAGEFRFISPYWDKISHGAKVNDMYIAKVIFRSTFYLKAPEARLKLLVSLT